MIEPTPNTLLEILAEVARRGITLKGVYDDEPERLRFHPRSAMTSSLALRIKANKPAILNLLRPQTNQRGNANEIKSTTLIEARSDTIPLPQAANAAHSSESGVLSVLSVSEPQTHGNALWSEEEMALLMREAPGMTPTDFQFVAAVKNEFAEFGVTIISVESAHGRGGWTRRQAATLLRKARLVDSHRAIAMRDAWAERMAFCMIDAGLTQDQAAQIALEELKSTSLAGNIAL